MPNILSKEQMMIQNPLKPPVNKARFYLHNDSVFMWVVFEYLDKIFYNDDYVKNLSPVLKTLRYFDLIIGKLSDDYFHTLYENGYGYMFQESIEGLFEINEIEMATIFCFADEFCTLAMGDNEESEKFKQLSENEKIQYIKKSPKKYLNINTQYPVIYNNIGESLEEIDGKISNRRYLTMKRLALHIQANPNAYVVDEDGNPFDENFTGTYQKDLERYGYVLNMKNGKPHGHFKLFNAKPDTSENHGEFEHGFLKFYSDIYTSTYNEEHPTTLREYYYEPYQDDEVIETKIIYFENSTQPKEQSRYYQVRSLEYVGEQKEWYKSGAIKHLQIYEHSKRIFDQWYDEQGNPTTYLDLLESGKMFS